MPRIPPVPAEPVDSGVYHYRLNGQATAIEEHWQRYRHESGEWQVNSSRRASGLEIRVDARVNAGTVCCFDVAWCAAGEREVRAEYELAADRVVVRRRVSPQAAATEEVLLHGGAAPPLLFPLMRIFTGPLLARLLRGAGKGAVVLPFIADPADRSGLLRPVLSQREARVVEEGIELELAGARFQCRRCEYLGDQYGPGSWFWLAADDLLVRYQWQQSPQQQWDVWLQRDSAFSAGPGIGAAPG
jgi:hypothetical protein